MTSMTGYAYAEQCSEGVTTSVEIKSYNSRFLDLSVNLPPFLGRLENVFREYVTNAVLRGKIDVYIRVKEENPLTQVTVNTEAAKSYVQAIEQIALILGKKKEDIPLSLIVQQDGVLNSQKDYDMDRYQQLIEPVFNAALKDFIADRQREGQNLKIDLLAKLDELDKDALFFKEWQPKMEEIFRENILRRFNELLGEAVDEQRVMTETAAMLVKYTINEEIVRLQSHLAALRSEIESNPTPGRKIDFLCQEINREINTIGSKNQFTEVGAMVINAKNALENIREQARNVE